MRGKERKKSVLLKVQQIDVAKLRAAPRAAAGSQRAHYKVGPLAASLKPPFQRSAEVPVLLCQLPPTGQS